jgi:RNA-directed DNA polymerase
LTTAPSDINRIQGILSHIHHVKKHRTKEHHVKEHHTKDIFDLPSTKEKRESSLTSFQKLYKKFLFYRYFVQLKLPLVLCEGKTDNIYLKNAIRRLSDQYPELGHYADKKLVSSIDFFNYTNTAHDILSLRGGTGDFKWLILYYKELVEKFNHRPLAHPVILLIDNDDGAKEIFSIMNKSKKFNINHKSSEKFFHICHNLYLVKTPEIGTEGTSCIESFFNDDVKSAKLNGKSFSTDKEINTTTQYGKAIFAEKIVRPNADTIDFSGFSPIIYRIVSVIRHYQKQSNSVEESILELV